MQKAYKINTYIIEGKECSIEFPCAAIPDELGIDGSESSDEWARDLIDEEIENHLSGINPKRDNYICVINSFGWRKINGVQCISVKKESDILSCILPRTECSYKIWFTETGFLLQNFHHDSCDGSEWYEVKVCDE